MDKRNAEAVRRGVLMNQSEVQAQLETHHRDSFGWAMSCCLRNRAEAEDVLQNAYLKILQGRARFNGRSSFKTWLFAVIRYTAADERRRHWLRHLRMEGYAKEQECQPDAAAPENRLEEAEEQTTFKAALMKLPRRQQEVLHLVFYQDLSVQAAAEVMGVSVGSARTHYERGKRKLRQQMAAGHEHET